MPDLNPSLAAGLGSLLVALAACVSSFVTQRNMKLKHREDQRYREREELVQQAIRVEIQAVHILVNKNWSQQVEAQNAVLSEHAAAMNRSAVIIERLMAQQVVSAQTAEAIRLAGVVQPLPPPPAAAP